MTRREFDKRCGDLVNEHSELLRSALACAARCATLTAEWEKRASAALAENSRRECARYLELEREISRLETEAER